MPASLCPAQMIFIAACGRGLRRQSCILKNWPLKSEWPVSQSSRMIWMYSETYS